MQRADGRSSNQLRSITFMPHFTKMAEGSMNVVMASNDVADGALVEVQGTGEKAPFSRTEFDQLLTLAEQGIREITAVQEQIVSSS